jgi:hypothetical protein
VRPARMPVLSILAAASFVVLGAGPLAAHAAAAPAATVSGGSCIGGNATVTWNKPGTPGLTGYQVVEQIFTQMGFPETQTFNVNGPDTLSASVPLVFSGGVMFNIFAVTAQGVALSPFDSVSETVGNVPSGPTVSNVGVNMAGNGTATVSFGWLLDNEIPPTGYEPTTITVTVSPGGASMTSTPSGTGFEGVTDTFTGLTNGVTYTFTSSATNICGTSGGASERLTPMGPVSGTITCTVTATQYPPAVKKAKQDVTVQASAGLASITNIQTSNATVKVASFTAGTTAPVVVVATKKNQNLGASWSFVATDVNGQQHLCS